MSLFTEPLAVEITTRKKRGRVVARVLRGFSYYDKNGAVYVVPPGFETDFASSPRWLWPIIPPLGSYAKAAVLHDFLYTYHRVSRADADRMFRDGARLLGVNVAVSALLWVSVRMFGARGWKKDRRA